MGQKRGKAEGSFVRETRAQTFDFYRDLVPTLKPWQPRARRLREQPAHDFQTTPQTFPPPFAAVDRDPGEASEPQATPRD
jgi:hypothetical protein